MDEVDKVLLDRWLHALAAHLSWWIYDPGDSEHPELKRSLPKFLDTNYELDPVVKVEISYKIRKIIEPTEADMTQKATMVATLSYRNPRTKEMVKKRAFILCFRGTKSASDWLTNLGATPNKHLGNSFRVWETPEMKLICALGRWNSRDLDIFLVSSGLESPVRQAFKDCGLHVHSGWSSRWTALISLNHSIPQPSLSPPILAPKNPHTDTWFRECKCCVGGDLGSSWDVWYEVLQA